MPLNKRQFLKAMAGTTALLSGSVGLSGCAAKFGSQSSYLTQVLQPQHQNSVFHWLDVAFQKTRDQRASPPRAAYNFAMPLVAGFLAANAIKRTYHTHFSVPDAPYKANAEIAYGVAFAEAASYAYQSRFSLDLNYFLSKFPDGQQKDLSIKIGRKIGHWVVMVRRNDGAEDAEVNYYLGRYQRRHDSLRWSPTLPNFSASPGPAFSSYERGLYPGHGQIKPWTMSGAGQYLVQPFYDPRSQAFADEFHHIKMIGAENSPIRTQEQSDIALFWEDGPWGITPAGHMMLIAVEVLQARKLSFMELARAFALFGMTQCDASINAWHNKYVYDILRPETAIRERARHFQNRDPRVMQNRRWRSFIPTPHFPSYTSGHSTFGAAGMELLKLTYGQDTVRLSGQSPDRVLWPQLDNVVQHWTSLDQIAEDNGMSRIYGGVHWHLDHSQAMWAGKKIAQQAFHQFFPKRH